MSKRIQGMRNILYEARLRVLNLHSLERRRLRRDLIEIFKWYRGYDEGDMSKVLKINNQNRTLRNLSLGKEWKRTGSLIERLMKEMASVIILLMLSQWGAVKDEGDRWN